MKILPNDCLILPISGGIGQGQDDSIVMFASCSGQGALLKLVSIAAFLLHDDLERKAMKALPLLFSLTLAACAHAADNPAADYGTPAAATSSARQVDIKPGTRNVNVYDGETVQFVVDGKRIGWNFNTRTREAVLDLNTIAPELVQQGAVRVWVLPNPIYFPG